MADNIKERQTTDSDQGGEGTRSFDQNSYSPLTREFPPGNTAEPLPPKEKGTK
jgi:hypothetical protein